MGKRWAWGMGPLLASAVWVQAAPPAAPDAFLAQARAAYYSETRERMDRFQCKLSPDWGQFLKDQGIAPEARARMTSLLDSLQFSLTLDRNGHPTITHQEPPGLLTPQQANGLKQIYGGMEQMMSGFFDTWNIFMVLPPLPAAGTPFHQEAIGPWRTLTYQDGAARVEVTLGATFDASEVKVTSQVFTSSVLPTFARTPKGLVLAGYRATYRTAQDAEATDLDVKIQNQEIDGCTLPRVLDLRGSYGGAPFHILVAFENGQVTKF